MHVRLADESYCVGGAASRDSYLRMEKIIEVAKACGAQVMSLLGTVTVWNAVYKIGTDHD